MDKLEQIIANYKPSERATELVSNIRLVLLVGISGAGKDTIKNRLIESGAYTQLITTTTRNLRTNDGVTEVNGVEYYFINTEEAEIRLASHQYVEVSLVHGAVNGSSIEELERLQKLNKAVLADVSVHGVVKYKKLSDDVIAIFVLPPSYEIWRHRLSSRYDSPSDFEAALPNRRDSAIKELTTALASRYYHFVINDDLERAVRVTDEIIQNSRVFNRKDDEARIVAGKLLEAIKNDH